MQHKLIYGASTNTGKTGLARPRAVLFESGCVFVKCPTVYSMASPSPGRWRPQHYRKRWMANVTNAGNSCRQGNRVQRLIISITTPSKRAMCSAFNDSAAGDNRLITMCSRRKHRATYGRGGSVERERVAYASSGVSSYASASMMGMKKNPTADVPGA